MILSHRTLGWAAVVLQSTVIVLAVEFGNPGANTVLVILGLVAFAFTLQTARSDPKDLTIALLLTLGLIVGLLADRSATWMIPLLSALLFVAAELHAAAWAALGQDDGSVLRVCRLRDSALLGGTGLLASGAVFAFRGAGSAPTGGFLVALGLVALLGALLFGGVGPMRRSGASAE